MRIDWTTNACELAETFEANARHACSLGLPFVTHGARGSLAVAGGGPSLSRNLDKLKSYDEVWGINRTAPWLCERGITASLFTVDPQYVPGMTGVDRAILSASVHPRVFEELSGKDVTIFHTDRFDGLEGFVSEGGPTSACRAVPLAVHMGYSSVTFFGCEASYDGASHAYDTELVRFQCIIRAGGRDYITQPDYQLQCQYLAPFLTSLPEYFKEESGGLLRAMIEHPDWEHVAFSGDIMERVLPEGMTLADLPPYQMETDNAQP
jgi:hypothetical protein